MRKKRLYTRRQAALLWTLAALAALAALRILAPYYLTPEAACKDAARSQLAYPARAVCRVEDATGRQVMLMGSEDGMNLYHCQFRWSDGWRAYILAGGKREGTRPFSADLGWSIFGVDGEVWDYHYVIGCLETEKVAALEVELRAVGGGYDQTVRLTAEDWIEDRQGTRWFLCVLDRTPPMERRSCHVTGYGADGTVLGACEVTGIVPRWTDEPDGA